jgi:hypothetical protein
MTNTTDTESWADRTLTQCDVFDRPEKWLTRPPDDAALGDLLHCRSLVEQPLSIRDQLRAIQLALLTGGLDLDPQRRAAESYAGRCAGDAKRLPVAEEVVNWLQGVESAIGARLDAGDTDPRILRTADFTERKGLSCIQSADLATLPLALGFLDVLPPNHPARTLLKQPHEHDDGRVRRRPALVLGLAPDQQPRRFYLADKIRVWTLKLIRKQELALADKPLHMLTEDELRRLRARESERGKLPGPAAQPVPPPAKADPPADWRERTSVALAALPRIETCWEVPPADTPLADLLAVRDRFVQGVEDVVDAPRVGAGHRFAALAAGSVRRDELTDIVQAALTRCDYLIGVLMDRAAHWSATAGQAAVADLLRRVEQLEQKRGKR